MRKLSWARVQRRHDTLQARKAQCVVDFYGHFVWYELITTDPEAAKIFYANVVGWDIGEVSMPGTAYTLFSFEETSVGGLLNLPKDARNKGAKPHWIGYVGVDDVDATTDRIKQLGGYVHVSPTNIPNVGRFSIVADPQMATLALLETLQPSQDRHVDSDTLGHVGWKELLAADLEKALAFYGELFDCDWARRMLFPLASAGRGNAARGSTTAEITTVKALAQQGGHLLSGSRYPRVLHPLFHEL